MQCHRRDDRILVLYCAGMKLKPNETRHQTQETENVDLLLKDHILRLSKYYERWQCSGAARHEKCGKQLLEMESWSSGMAMKSMPICPHARLSLPGPRNWCSGGGDGGTFEGFLDAFHNRNHSAATKWPTSADEPEEKIFFRLINKEIVWTKLTMTSNSMQFTLPFAEYSNKSHNTHESCHKTLRCAVGGCQIIKFTSRRSRVVPQ